MNRSYLDKVLSKETVDYLYHFGLCSTDACLDNMKNIKAVILSGSPYRTQRMAETWCNKNGNSSLFKFPKDERFNAFYTNDVLFSSHGMGMPSISIALQELMKLVYLVKNGNTNEIDKIFWCRVGTSGGLIEPGSVVLTQEALCSDFRPYRVFALGKEHVFDPSCPDECIENIIRANIGEKINIVKGRTVGTDCFYIEQNRLDGAVSLADEKGKMAWLDEAKKLGFKNIEMESPMMVGLLNHWGFSNFAVICCVLINRLKGDQITSTKDELENYSLNAEKVLWNFLEKKLFI